jgi:predicted unusual protein kinase regulating ubiquinone biosynthesis (AarF/ABC1/UbiB family)
MTHRSRSGSDPGSHVRRSRRTAAVVGTSAAVGSTAAAAAAAGTAYWLRDPGRRERLRRSARVWRLTARRAGHWAVVRVRGAAADEEARARLEQRFAIRSAEDVARELGNMKGAIMKAGQMLSFVAEGLPPEAQAALATLQAEVPPMAPSLAEKVVEDELGTHPERLFLDWDPVPVAAASIGQVHRAVTRHGELVAVKVQYPGVDVAIKSDLDNAELLYGMIASVTQRNLDVKGIVDELRARMGDELDYRIEAAHQREFADIYRGHPFIRIPAPIPELSAQRVLTSEWVDGLRWAEFEAQANQEERQRAGEILFRFAQGSIWEHGVFNGDPHPGNYRFHPEEGTITFLDFGLVKRWTVGELESLVPLLDAVIDADARGLLAAAETAGFLPRGHGLDADHVFEYASAPYVPYLQHEFTFTRRFVGETLAKVLDLTGPYRDVMATLNIPASYVILDRVVWGMTALLGRLRAHGPWRAILAEYRKGGPPATELGRIEVEWRGVRQSASVG